MQNTDFTITEAERETGFQHGWRINSTKKGGKTGKKIFALECIRGHVCLSSMLYDICIICKLKSTTIDKCVQNTYISGRKTFEFTCVRDHRYLTTWTSNRSSAKCKVCDLENSLEKNGKRVMFHSDCVYTDQNSRLHYTCKCGKSGYITEAIYKLMTAPKNGSPTIAIENWCSHGHKKGLKKEISRCLAVFSNIYGCAFDDNDSMRASDEGFHGGIRFTGFNRELNLAFLCTSDPNYTNDLSFETQWCKRKKIHFVVINDMSKSMDALAGEIWSVLMGFRIPSGVELPAVREYLNENYCPVSSAK